LIRRDLDLYWSPGEHNGTFRGNNHAFVTATAAIETFWSDDEWISIVRKNQSLFREQLEELTSESGGEVRGRGSLLGLTWPDKFPHFAQDLASTCFKNGLLVETSGADDEV